MCALFLCFLYVLVCLVIYLSVYFQNGERVKRESDITQIVSLSVRYFEDERRHIKRKKEREGGREREHNLIISESEVNYKPTGRIETYRWIKRDNNAWTSLNWATKYKKKKERRGRTMKLNVTWMIWNQLETKLLSSRHRRKKIVKK